MNRSFPRPTILVSSCLGFAPCRYDGGQLYSGIVDMLTGHVNCIDVCPEMEAGFGVPRSSIRLCMDHEKMEVWQPAQLRTVTRELQQAVDSLQTFFEKCDGAILKGKSPSCGLFDVKIYREIENPQFLRRSSGVFGKAVLKAMAGKAVEDEQRLSNLVLREHFFIKLYTWARFRSIAEQGKMGDLISFHAAHKLLFLACSQSRFWQCGRIVANHGKLPSNEVYQLYTEQMGETLKRPARRQAMVNTLYHAHGWVSQHLAPRERAYIVNTIEEYRDERIPLQAVTRLIEAQAIRFDRGYLLNQVLFRPYPPELADLSDSGKGREVQ